MFRSFLCLVALASLAACGPSGEVASAGSSPAAVGSPINLLPAPASVSPLAKTDVDDRAIALAFDGLDAAATAADALLAAGVVKPGTPVALKIAGGLDGTRQWLNIASHAQKAGQAADAVTAFAQASAAFAGVKSALSSLKGQ